MTNPAFESQHPRRPDGSFTDKPQSAPDVELSSDPAHNWSVVAEAADGTKSVLEQGLTLVDAGAQRDWLAAGHPNTYRFEPDTAHAAALSASDTISAAVLEKFPNAKSWWVGTTEYSNGYFLEGAVTAILDDDSEVIIEEFGADFEDQLQEMSTEEKIGYRGRTTHLAAFKSGARQPVLTDPQGFSDWRTNLTDSVRLAYPGLASVTIGTEEYDNGFFWVTAGTGIDADGNTVEVDLDAFADDLVEAAEYELPGRRSELTLQLR